MPTPSYSFLTAEYRTPQDLYAKQAEGTSSGGGVGNPSSGFTEIELSGDVFAALQNTNPIVNALDPSCITGKPLKSTLVTADKLLISDSQDNTALKHVTMDEITTYIENNADVVQSGDSQQITGDVFGVGNQITVGVDARPSIIGNRPAISSVTGTDEVMVLDGGTTLARADISVLGSYITQNVVNDLVLIGNYGLRLSSYNQELQRNDETNAPWYAQGVKGSYGGIRVESFARATFMGHESNYTHGVYATRDNEWSWVYNSGHQHNFQRADNGNFADCYANDFTPSSDIRIKSDFEPLENAHNIVMNLGKAAMRFTKYGQKNQIGWVGQDVIKIEPSLVKVIETEKYKDFHTVDYGKAVVLLASAYRGLIQKLERLGYDFS